MTFARCRIDVPSKGFFFGLNPKLALRFEQFVRSVIGVCSKLDYWFDHLKNLVWHELVNYAIFVVHLMEQLCCTPRASVRVVAIPTMPVWKAVNHLPSQWEDTTTFCNIVFESNDTELNQCIVF